MSKLSKFTQSLMALVLIACPHLSAGVDYVPPAPGDWAAYCGEASRVAKLTMELRQLGGSMPEMMDNARKTAEPHMTYAESIVVAAFEVPRFTLPEYQKNAIHDFESDTYLACVKEQRRAH